MSAGNIQARIKRGLNRAYAKTGSANSDKIYIVKVSESGGSDPLNPPTRTTNNIELVDALVLDYNISQIDGTEIKQGDKRLICNSDVEINQGETILHGSNSYYVVNVNPKAPTSDVLSYIPQLRSK